MHNDNNNLQDKRYHDLVFDFAYKNKITAADSEKEFLKYFDAKSSTDIEVLKSLVNMDNLSSAVNGELLRKKDIKVKITNIIGNVSGLIFYAVFILGLLNIKITDFDYTIGLISVVGLLGAMIFNFVYTKDKVKEMDTYHLLTFGIDVENITKQDIYSLVKENVKKLSIGNKRDVAFEFVRLTSIKELENKFVIYRWYKILRGWITNLIFILYFIPFVRNLALVDNFISTTFKVLIITGIFSGIVGLVFDKIATKKAKEVIAKWQGK